MESKHTPSVGCPERAIDERGNGHCKWQGLGAFGVNDRLHRNKRPANAVNRVSRRQQDWQLLPIDNRSFKRLHELCHAGGESQDGAKRYNRHTEHKPINIYGS